MNQFRLWVWSTFFANKSAMWTAIFTGVLTVFTYFVYQVAEKSDQTAQMTQRAFVSFGTTVHSQKVPSSDGKKWVIERIGLTWINGGSTPTKGALTHGNFELWPSDLPRGYGFEDKAEFHTHPIVVGGHTATNSLLDIPIDTLDAVRQGKGHLFVWGWMIYRDVFAGSPVRLTEFCTEITNVIILNGKADMIDLTTDLTWNSVPCAEHNCYDDDCTDYRTRAASY